MIAHGLLEFKSGTPPEGRPSEGLEEVLLEAGGDRGGLVEDLPPPRIWER